MRGLVYLLRKSRPPAGKGAGGLWLAAAAATLVAGSLSNGLGLSALSSRLCVGLEILPARPTLVFKAACALKAREAKRSALL